MLSRQILETTTEMQNRLSTTMHFCPNILRVDAINNIRLFFVPERHVTVHAIDRNFSCNVRNGINLERTLPFVLKLARRARAMLRGILWTETGLIREAMGTVFDVIYYEYREDVMPDCVLVEFDNCDNRGSTPDNLKVFPIIPVR